MAAVELLLTQNHFEVIWGCIAALARCGLLLDTELHGLLIGQYVTVMSPANMTDPIKLPFGCGLRWAQGTRCYMSVQIPTHEGTISKVKRGRSRTWPLVDIFKVAQQGAARVQCGCWLGCTMARPGEFNWTICALRRRGLMSNYFDHLFLVNLS